MSYIKVENETKQYQMGETTITANHQVSFEVERGQLTVILGPSGAGKSTVLNILGGMDSPTSGQVIVDGVDIATFNDRQLTAYRRTSIGFIFQFYNLIPNLTAKENVELASSIVPDALAATTVLEAVGLGNRIDNFPSQLSGGEQQRVAIARALAKNPDILLCNEPTGALDFKTGKQVLKLLERAGRKDGKTVIIITHNSALAAMGDRVIHINDAQVRDVVDNPAPTPVDEIEW
ncbi:ABC transporter ATP-binding protein [Secundilactobacillus kimchicus]|uniref:ABC transporter ATPase n=1 Tax=Secundilactobacillus kimchicus JCM 15530 TaxID=1302272 RepID=A0A0R1HVM6_9LACO|nr:ABC transporter ATP-binding protein [Secundilactobacillus kimchicus]KRK47908.1 ABC transporter ATPase [Secundilactobacillus kimchicus JCM 15530]